VLGIIYDWDLKTGRVARSGELFAITGFHPDHAEPTAEWWRQRVHPDDVARAERDFAAGTDHGTPFREAEYRVLHRDGNYRRVWDRAKTVYDGQGQPARIIGYTIDITEQYRVKEVLLENERRFRRLTDSNIIGVVFGDIHGGLSFANDEWLRMVGYSRQEFNSGQIGWKTVTPPEWLEVAERTIELARNGDGTCPAYEKEYLRKDGTRISVLLAFAMYGTSETVALILDLSELKRSVAALRESEERLSLAIEAARLGIWDCDLRTDQAVWSDHYQTMYGYTPGRPTRHYEEFAERLDPKDAAAVRAAFEKAMETRSEFRCVHRIFWPDGTIRWVQAHGRFYYDGRGQPIRSLGVLADVTDLKRAEEALRDADRRKDEFLAMLAHELRNPLSAVSNALAVLRLPGATRHDREWALDVADRQVANLVRLIDDLLDVSRISRGKINLKKVRIDTRTVVDRAIEAVRPFIDDRDHTLAVRIEPGPLWLDGDPTRLEQVLANLLNNAAKYSDRGGDISVSAGREGSDAVIRVRDTGVGNAPEMLPKIFDLFAQIDTSIDRAHGGLGIGLALVRMLVEMHSGRVAVSSAGPGKGSEFVVRLPLAAADTCALDQTSGPTGSGSAPGEKSLRILIVDDNIDALEGLARLLGLSGYEIATAAEGNLALAIARTFCPDVVLLDIGLPGMSGYDVAETMRHEGMIDTILIAISGYSQDGDRQRSRQAGFDHHLSKPVSLESLVALIEHCARP
jgi:PAS domain S-box-containing protein